MLLLCPLLFPWLAFTVEIRDDELGSLLTQTQWSVPMVENPKVYSPFYPGSLSFSFSFQDHFDSIVVTPLEILSSTVDYLFILRQAQRISSPRSSPLGGWGVLTCTTPLWRRSTRPAPPSQISKCSLHSAFSQHPCTFCCFNTRCGSWNTFHD